MNFNNTKSAASANLAYYVVDSLGYFFADGNWTVESVQDLSYVATIAVGGTSYYPDLVQNVQSVIKAGLANPPYTDGGEEATAALREFNAHFKSKLSLRDIAA